MFGMWCSIKRVYVTQSTQSYYIHLFLFRDENRIFIFARKLVVGGLFLMLIVGPPRRHTKLATYIQQHLMNAKMMSDVFE